MAMLQTKGRVRSGLFWKEYELFIANSKNTIYTIVK
jgi:hypothetical protein